MIKFLNIEIFKFTIMVNNKLTTTSSDLMKSDILSNLFTKCGKCPIRHNCLIHEDRIKSASAEIAGKKEKLELKKSEKPNDIKWNQQLEKELQDFSKVIWSKYDESVTHLDCEYEKKDIINKLTQLQSTYDFKDGRIYLRVQEYMQQAILNFRAFKEASRQSLISYKYTEDGSKIPIVNPILNYRLMSSKFMIDLLDNLDRLKKDDEFMDEIKTSGFGFYSKYLSKIPHKVIDITPEDEESSEDKQ